MRVSLPLMKNLLTLLAKFVLLALGVTAVVPATNAVIQKKVHELGITLLIFSNKEMKHILEMVKHLRKSGLLVKGISKTIEN